MAGANRVKLEKFKRDLKRWADDIGERTQRQKANATVAMVTELTAATPKVTGLTAGNWRTSVGARTSAVIGKRSASEAIAEARGKVMGAKKLGGMIFIANHVPWLNKLNVYSRQAAPGWIERAIARGISAARSMR